MSNINTISQSIQDEKSTLQRFLAAYFSYTERIEEMKTILLNGIDLSSFLTLRSEYISTLPNDDYINTPILYAAILTNSPTIIDNVITVFNIQNLEINISIMTRNTTTCLFLAAQNGFLETVQHLITKYNVKTNTTIEVYKILTSPLTLSIATNNNELIQYLEPLCERMPSYTLNSVLRTLVENGNLQMLQYFTKIYNIQLKDVIFPSGNNLLYSAVQSNNIECIEYLINNGVSIRHPGDFTMSPLMAAIDEQKWDVVKYLFTKVSQVEIDNILNNSNAMISIASDPNMTLELFDELVQLGFRDFEVPTEDLQVPVLEAAECGNLLIVKHLIEKYHVRYDVINAYGDGLCHAFILSKQCTIDMIQYCYDIGNDLNTINHSGEAPLSRAIKRSCSDDIIDLLIQLGAKFTTHVFYYIALYSHDTTLADTCIAQLGDLVTSEWLSNLLFQIIPAKNEIMFHHFVSKGYLDLNRRNDDHDTYLHVAVQFDCISIVKYLLSTKHRFETIPKSNGMNRWTPLDYAIKASYINNNIVTLLIQHGYIITLDIFKLLDSAMTYFPIIQLFDILYQNNKFSHPYTNYQQPTILSFLNHYEYRPIKLCDYLLFRSLTHRYKFNLQISESYTKLSPLHIISTMHRPDLLYFVIYHQQQHGKTIDFCAECLTKCTFLHQFILSTQPNSDFGDESYDIESVIDLIANF